MFCQKIKTHRIDIIAIFFLFVLFYITYFSIGSFLLAETLLNHNDILFGADIIRVAREMTDFDNEHTKTATHPLFVIILNPIGKTLAQFFSSGEFAAMVINNFFGALCIVLFYILLRKIGLNKFRGFLFSLMLGTSSSHFVFGSIPETFIISAAGIVVLLLIYLFLKENKDFIKAYFPAAILSFGITIISIIPSTIIFLSRFNGLQIRKRLLLTILFILAVFFLVWGFAVIQKSIYPTPLPGFPSLKLYYWLMLGEVNFEFFKNPLGITSRAVPHFLFYDVVAPDIGPNFRDPWYKDEDIKPIMLMPVEKFNLIKLSAYSLFALLILVSSFLIIKFKLYRNKIFIILGSYLFFIFCLHLFYDKAELFLFSCHYTFPWITLLALPFKSDIWSGKKFDSWLNLFLIISLAFIAINNLLFIKNILAVYS